MIKIIRTYNEKCPLKNFLDRQIEEANLEGYPLTEIPIGPNPSLVDYYRLRYWHTLIFTDRLGDEVSRLEGPFNAEEIEEALQLAKGILANRMKGTYL